MTAREAAIEAWRQQFAGTAVEAWAEDEGGKIADYEVRIAEEIAAGNLTESDAAGARGDLDLALMAVLATSDVADRAGLQSAINAIRAAAAEAIVGAAKKALL